MAHTLLFDHVHPDLKAWGDYKSLFIHAHTPILLKRVSSFAEALAAGGFFIYDINDPAHYEWYIGETAIKMAKHARFGVTVIGGISSKPADGGNDIAWSGADAEGKPLTYGTCYIINSREYIADMSVQDDKWAGKTLGVYAVVSNASYGFGNFSSVRQVGYPMTLHSRSGVTSIMSPDGDRGVERHRGSVVVALAFHKKLRAIIRDQTAKILEGSDKGEKYVQRAIDEFLSNGPDDVVYMPLVTTWAGFSENLNLTVGHWTRGREVGLRPDANCVLPYPFGAQGMTACLPPDVRESSFAEIERDPQNLKRAEQTSAERDGNVQFSERWFAFAHSFEGSAMVYFKDDTMKIPCPYYAWETEGLCGPANGSFAPISVIPLPPEFKNSGKRAGSYAGVDTYFGLRGALPALVTMADGSRRELGLTHSISNSDLFSGAKRIENAQRTLKRPTLSENPTPSEINESFIVERAAKDIIVAAPRLKDSWESYWSPITHVESAVKVIYDRACAIAEAEN